MQVRIFAKVRCAAVEVEQQTGSEVMRRLHGTHIGHRPIVVHGLIEFPDERIVQQLLACRQEVRTLIYGHMHPLLACGRSVCVPCLAYSTLPAAQFCQAKSRIRSCVALSGSYLTNLASHGAGD